MLRHTHAFVLALGLAVGCQARIAAEGQTRIDQKYAAGQVTLADPAANFFGVESRGTGQVRGNGALALTATELWFGQMVPDSELVIAVHDIQAVDLVSSHLGKSSGRQLVRVRYGPGDGDAVAWAVTDPDAWVKAIEQARAAK